MASLTNRNVSIRESSRVLVGAIILALSVYFLVVSAHFFRLTPESMGKYFDVRWALVTHVGAGAFALLTGPFLLWDRLRAASPKAHRRLGKAYLILVVLSGACAVLLSVTTAYAVSWAYAFSLQVWVAVWLVASFLAYRSAVRRQFKLHEEWMTRSYVVLLAFVLGALLFKVPAVAALGSFADVSPSIFWFSWAVPLYAYDVYLATVGARTFATRTKAGTLV